MKLIPKAPALAALLLASCGVSDDLTDRGIGGTGAIAGSETGVYGTITGFGSVFVNGLEISVDGIAGISVDGEHRPVDDLRVGQVTRIIAAGDGGLAARSLEVVHEVSGPAERAASGELVVAGQKVVVTADTIGASPATGSWVAVSGLRNPAGDIVASRLDERSPGVVSVSGKLDGTGSHLRIGGLAVRLDRDAAPGSIVTARGQMLGQTLVAQVSSAAPSEAFPASVGRIVVEGYVSGSRGRIIIGGKPEAALASVRLGVPTRPALAIVDMRRDAVGSLVATGVRGETLPGSFRLGRESASPAAARSGANGTPTGRVVPHAVPPVEQFPGGGSMPAPGPSSPPFGAPLPSGPPMTGPGGPPSFGGPPGFGGPSGFGGGFPRPH